MVHSVLVTGLPSGRAHNTIALTLNTHECDNGVVIRTDDIFDGLQARTGIPPALVRLRQAAHRPVRPSTDITVEDGELLIIKASLPLFGGKGGFGSLLRGQGFSFDQKKTTDFGAMRSLDGRRVRDVEAEKALRDWQQRSKDTVSEEKQMRQAAEEEQRRQQELRARQERIKAQQEVFDKSQKITAGTAAAVKAAMKSNSTNKRPRGITVSDSTKTTTTTTTTTTTVPRTFGMDPLLAFDSDESVSDSDEESDTPPAKRTKATGVKGKKGKTPATKTTPKKKETPTKKARKAEDISEEDSPVKKSAKTAGNTSPGDKKGKGKDVVDGGEGKGEDVPEFPDVDLSKYKNASSLEKLGLEHLKHELKRRGLKCGGTLAQRAKRLYASK